MAIYLSRYQPSFSSEDIEVEDRDLDESLEDEEICRRRRERERLLCISFSKYFNFFTI